MILAKFIYRWGGFMCKRGMKDMVAISTKIDEIIASPSKTPTKEEAVKLLRSCGILNENNNLKKAYKGIVTKVSDKHGKA